MRRYLVRFLKLAIVFFVTLLITLILNKILQVLLPVYDKDGSTDTGAASPVAAAFKRMQSHIREKSGRRESDHPKQGDFFVKHPRNIGTKKIDWNDYVFQAAERARTGIGEHGVAASVPASQAKERKIQYDANGFDALLSDMISLNRSVKDTRHKE